MTIGKLSSASDVSIDTIRYYEREKLMPPAQRTASGYRIYDQASLRRLQFIRRCKMLGFSLEEIRSLLKLSDNDGPSAQIKALTEKKLRIIEDKLKDLQNMHQALTQLSESCDGHGCAHDCPIIDALSATENHSF